MSANMTLWARAKPTTKGDAERRRVEEVVPARREQALAHQRHQQRRELNGEGDAERPERVAVGQPSLRSRRWVAIH